MTAPADILTSPDISQARSKFLAGQKAIGPTYCNLTRLQLPRSEPSDGVDHRLLCQGGRPGLFHEPLGVHEQGRGAP